MSKMGQKMLSALRSRIADYESATHCGRSDLELADYEMLTPHEAKVLVEYSRSRGIPQGAQISQWVVASLNGAAHVHPGTVRDHPELSAMTAIIRENLTPMPISRTASMVKIGAGRYMDTDKNSWKVVDGPNGEQFLSRVSEVDLAKLLEERKNRQRSGRYARVEMSMVRNAGTAHIETGDTVLYAEPGGGGLQKVGVVESISGDKVKIKGREGTMDRSYIFDLVDKSASAKASENKMLSDFMTEFLFSGNRQMGNKMKIK